MGHHRDDVLQTLLLNLIFAGQLGRHAAEARSRAKRAIVVIRPLVFCAEEDIQAFADAAGFPILPCDLCGSQEHLQRKAVGRLLDELEAERPGTKTVMLAPCKTSGPASCSTRACGAPSDSQSRREVADTQGVAVPERRLVRG